MEPRHTDLYRLVEVNLELIFSGGLPHLPEGVPLPRKRGDQTLAGLLAFWRGGSGKVLSYRRISQVLLSLTDVDVSHEALRRWDSARLEQARRAAGER